jgi:hypothetical protein
MTVTEENLAKYFARDPLKIVPVDSLADLVAVLEILSVSAEKLDKRNDPLALRSLNGTIESLRTTLQNAQHYGKKLLQILSELDADLDQLANQLPKE